MRLADGEQFVELPSGTRLKCNVSLAPSPSTEGELSTKVAICLHPWSWLGGRMDDPVLHALVKPLHARGYDVLRYNSRGVGGSSGWSSLTGHREAQDLKELLQWAIASASPVASMVLIGYSYGSLIVSLHPTLQEPKVSHVLLSYPLGARHWLTAFHGKFYTDTLNALMRDVRSNVLVLYGDADEFTSKESYEEWTRALTGEVGDSGGQLQVVKVDNATHFWRDHHSRQRLIESIERWVP